MFFILFSFLAQGQATNPSLHNLSTGTYSFTSWANTSTSSTYPNNMIFWRTGTQDPSLSSSANSNWTGAYNLTSGARINGQGASGISFVNTGSSGNLGMAVVGLNASNRKDISVSWTAGTLALADGNRVYGIRLQYKIGSGTWTDVPGPIEYSSSGKAVNHSQDYGPTTLPGACDNQAELYVRWFYYSISGSSGTRPQLRLDEISISSSCSAPSTQASGISYGSKTNNATTISWSANGNGNEVLVFMAQTSSGNAAPVNSTSYTANSTFGSGTQIGSSGWYCVYKGTGSSVAVSGLSSSTTYRSMVVAANSNFCSVQYNTSTATNNPLNVTTTGAASPTISLGAASNNFGNQVTGTNSSGFMYNVSGSNLTANITVTAPSNFQVSLNNSTWSGSVTVNQTGGNANQNVYVRFSPGSDNGANSGNVNHESTGATTQNLSVSGNAISSAPTTSASAFIFSAVSSLQMNVAFTSGNGNRRIVVAREGSAVSFTPSNGVAPSGVNSNFGSASDQGSGNKIVYDGTGNSFTFSGLSPLVTYHFTVYEYNVGSGTSQNYRTTSPLTGNRTTAQSLPVTWDFNASDLVASNGSGNLSLVGGATGSFATGSGSSDGVQGWNTSTYPSIASGNKSRGIQIMASTQGWSNILLSFDLRLSNTAANTWTVQYTTNGSTWTDFEIFQTACSGDCWNNNLIFNFSNIVELDDNPNAGFRVVATFDPEVGNEYRAANSASSYNSGGTARFDAISVRTFDKYWDVSAGAGNGIGGTGTWGTTFSTVSNGSATLTTHASTDFILFGGTAGEITLSADQTFAVAQFDANNYGLITTNTTARTLSGNIQLGSNINLKVNQLNTANRTIGISGKISGGSNAKLVLRVDQTGTNTSRLNLAGSGSTILLD